MTRSLSSNLIKYSFVNYDKEEKILIDSDSKLPSFKPLGFDNLEVIKTEERSDAEEMEEEQKDIEAVNKKVEHIINQAEEDAKVILQNAKEEAEAISEEAKKQGFQQGYEDGKAEVAKLQEDLKNQIQDNAKEHQRIIQTIEPQYTNLVIKLLEKLTGIVSSEYKSVILHLIQTSLEDNENEENYCIRVSREDYDCVKNKIDLIKSLLKENANVEIMIDNKLEKSQCFIETDTSVIDCSLNVQLENLVTDLRLLAGI